LLTTHLIVCEQAVMIDIITSMESSLAVSVFQQTFDFGLVYLRTSDLRKKELSGDLRCVTLMWCIS
jgi:hypothetical protein